MASTARCWDLFRRPRDMIFRGCVPDRFAHGFIFFVMQNLAVFGHQGCISACLSELGMEANWKTLSRPRAFVPPPPSRVLRALTCTGHHRSADPRTPVEGPIRLKNHFNRRPPRLLQPPHFTRRTSTAGGDELLDRIHGLAANGHLVGAGAEVRARDLERGAQGAVGVRRVLDPAADGERHEHLGRGRAHDGEHRLVREQRRGERRDVQQADPVREVARRAPPHPSSVVVADPLGNCVFSRTSYRSPFVTTFVRMSAGGDALCYAVFRLWRARNGCTRDEVCR
jgi:hypothetical protein